MENFKQYIKEQKIGGFKMKLIKSTTDDDVNITYELYKGKERAATRVIDNDVVEVIDLRLWSVNDFKKAEKAYNDAIKFI